MVIPGDDEDDSTIVISLLVVMRDDQSLRHNWEPCSVVDDADEGAAERVNGLVGCKLEPAEVVHEVLEHRWYMSEREDRNVPMAEAVQSYLDDELRHRRDEAAIMLTADAKTIGIDEDAESVDS